MAPFLSQATRSTCNFAGAACLWGLADFIAQTYSSHRQFRNRRACGEVEPAHSRSTMTQMYQLLDKQRLAQSSSYAIFTYPLLELYTYFLRRYNIMLTNCFSNCAKALALQQIVVTPLLIWGYFEYMSILRGGFTHPQWISSVPEIDDAIRDKWDVAYYIWNETKGYPLMSSWAVFIPIYALAYFGPFRGFRLLYALISLPWLATLSFTQS